jgi:sulfur relay (sulfurtransferase) DsrF/TusC family protein
MLHFLRGRGVAVYVSRQALQLRRIGDAQFDHIAEVVDEERIVELLAGAGMYVSY